MCRICIKNKSGEFVFDVDPRSDVVTCLMTAAMAAVPCFLESFMKCITQTETPEGHKPGDRTRCT